MTSRDSTETYLDTKSVKKLHGKGILNDFDFRNIDFDDEEPIGYNIRVYDKEEDNT